MNEIKIPTKEECLDILNKNKTPSKIIDHCKTVCEVAEDVTNKLIAKETRVNKDLVVAAAMLHDNERQKDNHVIGAAKLLKSMGFPEVSEVIRRHGLYRIENEEIRPKTIEEKNVFYADKRVAGNKIVSLKERFEDLKIRYKKDFGNGFEFTKKIEKELMQ